MDDSTFDLWHTSASADGAWSSPDVELLDGVDGAWVRGSIFSHAASNGGADGYLFWHPGAVYGGALRLGIGAADGG